MKAAGADVIVVLSHLGFTTAATATASRSTATRRWPSKLNTAGKPVNLIIGGHSHYQPDAPATDRSAHTDDRAGRLQRPHGGRADVTVGTDGRRQSSDSLDTEHRQPDPTSVRTTLLTDEDREDPTIDALITGYATDPDYLALVNTPIGYCAVDLPRSNTGDNMMGTFIDDAIYNYLNTDAEPENDVDLFFNNAGGIRTDWCYVGRRVVEHSAASLGSTIRRC